MTNNRYPHTPGSRRGAPDTSRQAGESVAEVAKTHRAQVLEAVTFAGAHGLTGDEVAAVCDLTVYQVRSRLAELRAAKLIDDSKRRSRLGSGRRGAVWVLAKYAPKPDDPQGVLLAA